MAGGCGPDRRLEVRLALATRIGVAVTLVVASALLSVSRAGGAPPAGVLVVGVGGSADDPAYLPIHAALALGTFEAEGVAVVLRRAKHPTAALELLRNREAAVAVTTLDQAIRGGWARGAPVRVVVAHLRAPAAALLVSASATARITRVQDLRGQKIGIPGPGTTGHHLLLHLLEDAHVKPWQADLQSLGGSALLTRLGTGDLAAALVDEPWATRALETRAGAVLLDLRRPDVAERALGGPFYEVVSVTPAARPGGKKTDKAASEPAPLEPPPDAALAAYARALIRVQTWLGTTPAVDVAERLPTQLVGDRPRFVARLEALRTAYATDGEATPAGLAASVGVLRTGSPWPVTLVVGPKELREPDAVTGARASLGPTPPAP